YYFKCSYDDSLSKFRLYRGKDCIKWFMQELKSIVDYCDNVFNNIVPMENLSREQMLNFENAKVCHICEEPFEKYHLRVRDHNHFTGEFRGAAHQHCNLN